MRCCCGGMKEAFPLGKAMAGGICMLGPPDGIPYPMGPKLLGICAVHHGLTHDIPHKMAAATRSLLRKGPLLWYAGIQASALRV